MRDIGELLGVCQFILQAESKGAIFLGKIMEFHCAKDSSPRLDKG